MNSDMHLFVTRHLMPELTIEDRLGIRLINMERNEELLTHVPFMTCADLAVVVYCVKYGAFGSFVLNDPQEDSVIVNHDDLREWGITVDELFMTALRSSMTNLPMHVEKLSEAVHAEDKSPLLSMDLKTLVLSNDLDLFGASVMLYPGALQKIAGEIGTGMYILPCSIHEVLLVPEREAEDVASLRRIVQGINHEEVAPREVLSDQIYYYDKDKDEVELAVLPGEEGQQDERIIF